MIERGNAKDTKRSLYSIRNEISSIRHTIKNLQLDIYGSSAWANSEMIKKYEKRLKQLNKARRKIERRRKWLRRLGLRKASFGGKN